MRRTSLSLSAAVVALSALSISPTRSVLADPPIPVSSSDLTKYANELAQAFPGQVDIYLASNKDFDLGHPSLGDVRIVGCSAVAGTLYYVVRHASNGDTFVPQSQIVAIHNHK